MNKLCPICNKELVSSDSKLSCNSKIRLFRDFYYSHYIEYEDAISCYYFYNNIMYYGFVNDRQKYFVLYAYNNYRFSEELINMPYNNEPIISLIEKYSKLLIFQ